MLERGLRKEEMIAHSGCGVRQMLGVELAPSKVEKEAERMSPVEQLSKEFMD
jgi:hypothetical protein